MKRVSALLRVPCALAVTATLLSISPQRLHAQAGTVSGAVVSSGLLRPLSGVQVTVAGQAATSRGAVSDGNGHFRIAGLSGSQVLLTARLLGYRPESLTVNVGANDVHFVMSQRALELDQIVVTGTIGGEQRRALGTSVASVDASDIVAKAPVLSVENLLNARAPGVVVLPGTGQVGSGSQIRVRGIGTFSLSSNPLIYVDGVRVDNQTGTGIVVQAFSSGVISRLNDFDPEEIENIEVLKGPAAATLYGTEAARGVINIITKKGASGDLKYAFTLKSGNNYFQDAENRIPTNYCNSFTNTACRLSPGDTTLYSVNVVQTEKARGTPLFRDGGIYNYGLNVSGGTSLYRFFASGDMNVDQGIDWNNQRTQRSARTNLSVTPNERFEFSSSVGYIKSKTDLSCEGGCGGSLWGSLYSNPVNTSQFCTASSARTCGWGRGFNSSPPEAYRATENWQDVNRLTASATVRYNPARWFSNRISIGTDYTLEGDEQYRPYQTNDTVSYFLGSYYDGFRFDQHHQAFYNTYDYAGTMTFDPTSTINSKTSGGVQYYTNYNTYVWAEGDHFPAPGLSTISAAGTKPPPGSNNTQNNTLGFYGQQEFNWRQQLYLTGAVRVDNNSAFGNDIKWVTYPKASVSWVASDNPRTRDLLPQVINNLRFRAAYGVAGQQPGYNTALRTLSPVAGPNSASTLSPSTFGNPELKPERVLGTELGFEAGLFNDRLGIDFTYYNETSKDAILSRGVAPSTGFGASSQFFNAGQINKYGVEASLKAQVVQRRRFAWESQFNIATNAGKIVRLNGTDTTIDLGSISHRVGYAPFSWFSYRVLSAKYDPTTRKADPKSAMCDNGQGQPMACYNASGVVQAPKVYLGRAIPPVEGSWSNTFTFFQNFHLFGMLDYARDFARLDNNLRIRCQIFLTCLEYVQPAQTDPRLLVQMQSNGTLRDFVINNSQYVRLREISVTYDVPQRVAGHLRANGLSLNAAMRNVHTWTPYTGLDPESQFLSGGNLFVDQAEYPQLATFLFTARVNY